MDTCSELCFCCKLIHLVKWKGTETEKETKDKRSTKRDEAVLFMFHLGQVDNFIHSRNNMFLRNLWKNPFLRGVFFRLICIAMYEIRPSFRCWFRFFMDLNPLCRHRLLKIDRLASGDWNIFSTRWHWYRIVTDGKKSHRCETTPLASIWLL